MVNNYGRIFPDWNVDPAVSKPYVPLTFGVQGNDFVSANGNLISAPKNLEGGLDSGAAEIQQDAGRLNNAICGKYPRSWHFSHSLKNITQVYRVDQARYILIILFSLFPNACYATLGLGGLVLFDYLLYAIAAIVLLFLIKNWYVLLPNNAAQKRSIKGGG